jgi:hypothetical protein
LAPGQGVAEIEKALPQAVTGDLFAQLRPQERGEPGTGEHPRPIDSQNREQRTRFLAGEE